MKENQYTKNGMIVFLIIVIIASAIVEGWSIKGGPIWSNLLLMWIPALSAMTANIVMIKNKNEKIGIKEFINRLGIRGCKTYYIALGALIPLIYLLIPYIIYWRIFPNRFAYNGVALPIVLKDVLPLLILGIFFNLITAIGEEIGWRGFLFPALLSEMNLKRTLLITSLFWACWHLPILIFGDYMSGAPVWYKIPAFILCVIPIGIIAGLFTYQSKSVWPATFLHAAHNNFDQAVFGVITGGDKKMFYVSETGFLTIISAWMVAVVLFKLFTKGQTSEKK